MGPFSRKDQAQAGNAISVSPAAREDLNEVHEWGCELVRPPKALIGRLHRNLTADLVNEEAAVTAELERRVAALRTRAALLDPVPNKSSFKSGMRDALEQAQRRRYGLNPGDIS